jgi:transcriptional regulator with XRE-family HTH domain
MEQMKSLVKQLQSLRTYYELPLTEIVTKSGVSIATVSKTLQGRYFGVQLHNFIAIADAMRADVVLKPRDPRFIEHLKNLLPDIPIIE